MKNVAVLMFDDVETLDFAGPYEVFAITEDMQQQALFNVFTVAQQRHIKARHGLLIQANYIFYHHPPIDILVIPGGHGAKNIELHNPVLQQWLLQAHQHSELTLSVCTGVFILAEAGLLSGLKVTTHWREQDRLARDYPSLEVQAGVRYVDQAKIITSAGISSGMYAALYAVAKIHGPDIAENTAKRIELDWTYTEVD